MDVQVDETEVAELLERLRRLVGSSGDAVLGSVLEALDESFRRWAEQRDLTVAAADDHDRAASEVVSARVRLDAITRAIERLDFQPDASVATADVPDDVLVPPAGPASQHRLSARLLGTFEFTQNGRPLDGGNGFKAQKLLKLLLASAQRPIPRDVLIEHLWPDVSTAAGRRNVHQAVHALRKTLRERDPDGTHVVLENECYRLDRGVDLWCDVTEYESWVRRARELEAAGDVCGSIDAYGAADRLYRGDYLEDSPFEEWTIAERERLRMVQADVAHHLGELLLAADRLDEAIAVSQRALARDPADESAHQRVMRCHLARGQRTQALQQFDQCAELLRRKYGLSPTAETLALRQVACDA